MRLILDSNLALKLVLPETDVAIAVQLLDDSNAGIHELLAPNVFPVEIAHSSTRAQRQGCDPLGTTKIRGKPRKCSRNRA